MKSNELESALNKVNNLIEKNSSLGEAYYIKGMVQFKRSLFFLFLST